MHTTHNPSPITRNPAEMHAFSAKERDMETGLSYFGARYYSSDLSIWLSVDPMADKYPSMSPYTYCANNPVKLVDPNGEDWFENELTGDIYYSRDYRKGDENLIDGEGWKWMGVDNMFDKSPTQVLLGKQYDRTKYVKGDEEGVTSAFLEGNNAKKFMSDMGYDFKPTKEVANITEIRQQWDISATGAPKYHTNRYQDTKTLSSKYVPKNAVGSYTVQNHIHYKDERLGPFVSKTTWTEYRHYTYSTSFSAKVKSFFKQIEPILRDL